MLLNALIAALALFAFIFFNFAKPTNGTNWRAAITPLASIIGSGFLVVGPILIHAFGYLAPAAMLLLCALAYGFGWAIRENINHIEQQKDQSLPNGRLELLSSALLIFAYFISVAYYLNLFGAFFVKLTPFNTPTNAKIVTCTAFLVILGIGISRGFHALEGAEKLAVSIKLGVITSLICALCYFFETKAVAQDLIVPPVNQTGIGAFTLLLGLIVVVQGFETSRYLGNVYSARIRINSMRIAQLISTAIYLAYISLLTFSVGIGSETVSETAIINLTANIATILPILLVAAALSAQFSAAIADTSGAAGLLQGVGRIKINEKLSYFTIAAVGIVLTWALDIFAIIGLASRAFAIYYAIQSAIACKNALHHSNKKAALLFFTLAIIGATAAIFAQNLE